MTEKTIGIVVCHGELAAALVRSAEEITGIKGLLIPISNAGCGRANLEEKIAVAIAGRPAVVFVDMPSGSCLFAAARQLAGKTAVRVVTGVNLAMLLDFVFQGDLPPEVAADRAVDTGTKAISAR